MRNVLLIILCAMSVVVCARDNGVTDSQINMYGVFTVDDELCVGRPDDAEPKRITDGWPDYKPSWSPDGKWIVFFRIVSGRKLTIPEWKTKICVIRPDGTDLRELTDGTHNDLNPTWTRDGKNNIIINRCDMRKSRIYFSTVESKPGEEVLVSDPAFDEFAHCGMKDGRLLIMTTRNSDQYRSYYFSKGDNGLFYPPFVELLSPHPGNIGKYDSLGFDERIMMLPNRVSLSPDETKIIFERDDSFDPLGFAGHPLVIADFNSREAAVRNMKTFYDTPFYEYALYPAWTQDSKAIIYFGSFAPLKMKLYIYDIANGTVRRISPGRFAAFKYYCGYGSPK